MNVVPKPNDKERCTCYPDVLQPNIGLCALCIVVINQYTLPPIALDNMSDSVASKSNFLCMYMKNHPDTLVAYVKHFGKVEGNVLTAKMSSIDSKVIIPVIFSNTHLMTVGAVALTKLYRECRFCTSSSPENRTRFEYHLTLRFQSMTTSNPAFSL